MEITLSMTGNEMEANVEQDLAVVKRDRFDLAREQCYILQGTWPKEGKPEVFLDRLPLEAEISDWENVSALERFTDLDSLKNKKITMRINLPRDLKKYKKLNVYGYDRGKKFLWFSASAKQLAKRMGKPQFYLEEVQREPALNTCSIRGWHAFREPVEISVVDLKHQKIPFEVQYTNRPDVTEMFKEWEVEEKCGFYLEIRSLAVKEFWLIFSSGNRRIGRKISMKRLDMVQEKTREYVEKGSRYLKLHGPVALAEKVGEKLHNRDKAAVVYQKWLPRHLPSKAELERQKQERFSWEPLFSVVVPLYKTPEKYLRSLVASLQEQTYPNWELCLSDGSGKDSPIRELLQELQKEEPRIRVISHEQPLQISENANAAIQAASGDFIVFADHDDELTAHALYECAKALNEDQSLEVLYSDEDKMSMDGHKYFQPHFKPDFNIDLLCTVNYICHLFVAKKELVNRVGMLRSEFDGAQDYDFIFRCVENAGREKIHHIPQILYHWRSHEDSTSENPESKLYAFEAGQRAVQAHYDRIGIKAQVSKGEFLGLYRTKFLRDTDPLISIIIPNKDHVDDLKRCMESIEKRSVYRNYEYIIVENNSTEQETFDWYQKLEAENPRVRVVYYQGSFNYSKINNFGETYANGEYLLLLNNDTEIINEDCLEELLGYCTRPDVGIVGARLYYEDDTIQHAGVVIGFGGIAGHCFVQQKRGFTGYCHRIICAQDYSAVTAACMMVKKSVYEEVGGLTEGLEVAFNDVDFCLKVNQAGYLVVYNPYAELYHYESKSRGLEDTPEKVERFQREIKLFESRWPDILRDGDPYYNPNLTLDSQDFSLRRI